MLGDAAVARPPPPPAMSWGGGEEGQRIVRLPGQEYAVAVISRSAPGNERATAAVSALRRSKLARTDCAGGPCGRIGDTACGGNGANRVKAAAAWAMMGTATEAAAGRAAGVAAVAALAIDAAGGKSLMSSSALSGRVKVGCGKGAYLQAMRR